VGCLKRKNFCPKACFTHTATYAHMPLFMGSWNMQEHLDWNLFCAGDGRFCGGGGFAIWNFWDTDADLPLFVLHLKLVSPLNQAKNGHFQNYQTLGSYTCADMMIWQVDLTSCHLSSDLRRGRIRGWQANLTSATCQVPLVPKTQV